MMNPALPAAPDADDGGFTQARHEVEVDQSAEQYQDEPAENGGSHSQDMAQNRAAREIFHDEEVR